jgi:hypothetical protein
MDEMPGSMLTAGLYDSTDNQPAHFHHQRTPGQILSLTSNIEFSPYLSYLADNGAIDAAAVGSHTPGDLDHHHADLEQQKQLMMKASNLVSKSTHHNHNCRHVCKYRSRADKVPVHVNHQQHHTLKRVNQESFVANLNLKKTNASNVTNLSFNDSLAVASSLNKNNSSVCRHRHRHLLDSTALGGATKRDSLSNKHHSSVTSCSNKNDSHLSDALCQRRMTPLRWSKKMSRRRKSIFKNLSALNPSKSSAGAMLKPLIKGTYF